MTCKKLIERYLDSLGNRPASIYYRQVYAQHLEGKPWLQNSAYEFPRAELIILKEDLAATPSQARRVVQLISQAYSWAAQTVDRNTRIVLYSGENPVRGIDKPGSGRRETKMDLSQIKLFLSCLDFLSKKHRAFFLTRLLAPGRILEACTMKLEHIDLQTGKWYKPTTKTGLAQYTYIPWQAREAIKEHLASRHVQSEYVFQGFYGHHVQPGSFRKAWAEIRRQLGMPNIQLLDFRRTMASYLFTELKADRLVAKAVLNHYNPDVTAVYVRLDHEKLVPIIQGYADWIWQLKEGGHHEIQLQRDLTLCDAHSLRPTIQA